MKSTVNIIKLPDIRVAAFREDGPDPETKAFDRMIGWAWDRGLLQKPGVRVFGFDLPSQTASHGYEVWITVDNDMTAEPGVVHMDVPGADYASMDCNLGNIGDSWRGLMDYLRDNGHTTGSGQCLEEHIVPEGLLEPDFDFIGIRLLEPVVIK